MYANGEFCHTFEEGELNKSFNEKDELPLQSSITMKNGDKRKVSILLKRAYPKLEIKSEVGLEKYDENLSFIFAMYSRDDNGGNIVERRTITRKRTNLWIIDMSKLDLAKFKNITIFIQLLSEKAMSAIKETDNMIQKNMISKLVEDYAAMRKSGLMSDITIVCEGVRLPAHKAVLSARSEVFAAMFSHKENMENQQNEVLIDDVDIDTMEKFLTFLYEAALPEDMDFDGFAYLLKVGDKYQVDSLTQTCAAKLAENICTDNAVQAAIIGFLCNNDSMKIKAIEAIVNRDKGVTLSSMKGYKELRSYPDLFTEIVDFGHGSGKPAKRKREDES